MSTNATQFLKNKRNFSVDYVGGNNETDKDTTYIKNQKKVIDSLKDQYPANYEPPYNDMYTKTPGLFGDRFPPVYKPPKNPEKYDPLSDFLFKRGLLDRNNVTRYYTQYLNIDSSLRNKLPHAMVEEWILLDKDPFLFTRGSDKLFIKQSPHNFQINDKISISGVKPIKRNLKIKVKSIDASNQNGASTVLQFTHNSKYMTVNIPSKLVFNNDVSAATAFDVTGLTVDIAGVKGFPGSAFIENIPINSINGTHQILLINPDDPNNYSDTKFYIELIKAYSGEDNSFLPSDYNFTITFNYVGGVPLNELNAEYPIDPNNLKGYHLISGVAEDGSGYTITLSRPAAALDPNSITTFSGGSDIYVAKVTDIEPGYPDPNHYIVKLEKTYDNVIKFNLVSSEFPNTEKVIKALPLSKKNNKFYWQNLEDGDHIYSVEIDPGNYNPADLIVEFNNQVFGKVKRISASQLGDPILQGTTFTDNNYIQMSISSDKDIVVFRSFKEALLVKPFIETNPPIDTKGGDLVTSAVSYDITIQQQNHGLSVGDIILISGAVAYLGIPVEVLNKEQVVTKVIDKDRYTITVEHFNLNSTRTDNGGGSSVSIFVPNIFRIRFDFPDTFGRQLGFRKVGEAVAVTKYDSVIANTQAYPNEPTKDEGGNIITYTNNSLLLSGDNYILMTCPQVNGIYTAGKVKNSVAKILLTCAPGKVLFNTFVNAPIYMHDPIPTLTELEFAFYSPDGTLFNFNGLDHSFTLEITSLVEIPKGTGVTSFIGKIN
jgi:hypothetical protein